MASRFVQIEVDRAAEQSDTNLNNSEPAMTFYVYETRRGFSLSDGSDLAIDCSTQAAAIDAAVRIAQDMGRLYTINYWQP